MSENFSRLPLIATLESKRFNPIDYQVRILDDKIPPHEIEAIRKGIAKVYYLCSLPHDLDPNTGEMIDLLSPSSAEIYPWAISKGWLFGTDSPSKINSYINKALSKDTGQNNYFRIAIIQDVDGEVVGWSRLKMVRHNPDVRSGKVWQLPPNGIKRFVETPKGPKKLFRLRRESDEIFFTIFGPKGETIVKKIRALSGSKTGKPSGYLWFTPQDRDSYRKSFVEIDEMAVNPAFRDIKNLSGQTPAELLLGQAEAMARKSNFKNIFAWVCTGPYFPNFASWSFFKNRGFNEVSLVESLSEKDVTVAVALKKLFIES